MAAWSIVESFNLPSRGRIMFSQMLRSSRCARGDLWGRCSSLVALPKVSATWVPRAHHGARPSDLGPGRLRALELLGALPGGLHRPVGKAAYGKAALTPLRRDNQPRRIWRRRT